LYNRNQTKQVCTPDNNNTVISFKAPTELTPTIQTKPPPTNFQPLAGLGGGISHNELEKTTLSNTATEMENQIKRMEDDILQLKRTVNSSNKSVQKLEESITNDIQNIDMKINNTANDLWKRVEGKIDSNNALLQDQVSDNMATKLAMNNMENNISLLDRMELLMQTHFEKMQESNKETTNTITTISENQDINIQQLNSKIEKTTKQLTEMIDNVALAKGQRSGRYHSFYNSKVFSTQCDKDYKIILGKRWLRYNHGG
jgi:hypothetical protein